MFGTGGENPAFAFPCTGWNSGPIRLLVYPGESKERDEMDQGNCIPYEGPACSKGHGDAVVVMTETGVVLHTLRERRCSSGSS
jgi:hypothetical protein